ncbi:MAG: hypothetical protein M3Y59_11550 [Myxococcota bacterium]|nr:hypothetical protein [Myxococcota bacterium]
MSRIATLVAVLSFSQAAFAQQAPPTQAAPAALEKPTPEAIRSFWSYYFKGQGSGPALADAKLCLEVARDGEHRHDCQTLVPSGGIKAGTSVILWQAYLLPSGEVVEDLSVQVLQGDTVRETKDIKLRGDSIRTRNWTTVRIPTAGTWTLRLLRAGQELKSFTVKAS